MAAAAPRRRNTAEEIRRLDVVQSRARARGVIAVLGGAGSVAALAGAVFLIGRADPPPGDPGSPVAPPSISPPIDPAEPAARPEPFALPDPPHGHSRKGHPKDPIAALGVPQELPMPASPSAPLVHTPQAVLEQLGQSLADQKRGAIQLCFEHELKRDPRLRGKAMVEVTLKAPHRLATVVVRDDLHRPGFTRCVGQAMRSVQFPILSEDVSVQLPFALRAPEL
jgi:hypothetical protein